MMDKLLMKAVIDEIIEQGWLEEFETEEFTEAVMFRYVQSESEGE